MGNKLVTFCGTPAYCAPEIYTKVTTKESCGFPAFEDPRHFEHSDEWCRGVVESAQDWDSEPLIEFLLSAMLVVNPVLRYSAQNCYTKALRIPIPSQKRSFTAPTPTLNSESTLLGGGWLQNSRTEAWNQTAEPPNDPLDSTPNPEECVPRATTKSVNGDDDGYMPQTDSWTACEADMAALERLPHPKT